VALLLAAVPSLWAAAAARSPESQAALVWPTPPDEPRIAYVRSFQGSADWGRKVRVWTRVINFVTGRKLAEENFVKPFGIALDEDGNVCIADSGAASIRYFERATKKCRRWEKIGRTWFALPVAIVKTNGTFFVADSGLGKILAFTVKGKPLFEISENITRPSGLAILNGKLYVADAPAHCIEVFDLKGQYLSRFGTRGAAPGELNFPTHLAAGPDGCLLVTDSANARVQIFDKDGHFEAVLGGAGDAPGRLGRPKGVAVDSFGHVYVVDAVLDCVEVFDMGGRSLMRWGSAGSRPGEFWLPAGIAIGRDNEILVADVYNRRVQVFKYIGKP
jgi:DNA-binding beta-propeller fold protein YncE